MPQDSLTHLLWFLGVPAALLAAAYLVGPIVVWSIARVRKDPTAVPFDPERTPAPPEVQADLDRSVAALRPFGFEPASYLVLTDLLPDAKMIAVLLTQPAEDAKALINVSIGTVAGQAKVQDRCIEFVTAFADGGEHHTLWSQTAPPLPRLPAKTVLQVDSDDAAFLWQIHRAAVEAWRTAKNRPLPDDVTTAGHVSREVTKSWTELAEIGWTRLDDSRGEFRLTPKGACLITWAMLPPVSGYRRAARRRRNARLFAEWGLTEDA